MHNISFPKPITSRRHHTNYYHHTPRVNVSKHDQGYLLEMAIPGINKDELTINLEKNVLTISHKSDSNIDKRFIKKGFDLNGFTRSIQLPEDVDVNKLEAKVENGILSLNLPLSEAVQPRTINIQ